MNRRRFMTSAAASAAVIVAPKPLMALAPSTPLPGEWMAVWPIEPGVLYWTLSEDYFDSPSTPMVMPVYGIKSHHP